MNSGSHVVKCTSCGTGNRVPAAASGIPHCASCKADLPWIAEADDDTYTDVVVDSKLPVLLDLWAPWCPPCRMVSPVLEKLAATYAGRIKLAKINVDDSPRTQALFGVRSIPTLLIIKDGEEIDRTVGAAPEHVLTRWLEQVLA